MVVQYSIYLLEFTHSFSPIFLSFPITDNIKNLYNMSWLSKFSVSGRKTYLKKNHFWYYSGQALVTQLDTNLFH